MGYRCEDRIKISELMDDIGVILEALTLSFRKLWSSPLQNEPSSEEMHVKIQLLSRVLKLGKPWTRL